MIPRRDLPIVVATFILAGGASRQRPDEGGLAQLTTSMMDEGTATRSSHELAMLAEGMGTHLATSCGWDGTYLSIQCLTPHLLPSLDLLVDIVRNPTFPESEWERIHGQSLAGLRAERDSAESRAYRGLLAALYGPDHPYRVPIDGDEALVARHTRADVCRFHERYHGPSHAACVIAGDVDPDEITRVLDERLDGWAGPEVARPAPPAFTRGSYPRILVLDRPAAPQAVARVGHVGISRLDPDYTEMLVLNQILGGQFMSRLNEKLREEKGFTYGVRSHFDCRRGAGPFWIGASLQADRLADALADLRHETEALLSDRPPTRAELDDARRSLIEGQARHFETPAELVARYANLTVNDLPADHYAGFVERLEGVSITSLTAAANRLILPSSFVVVVTADASTVLDQLQRLHWAELEVIQE